MSSQELESEVRAKALSSVGVVVVVGKAEYLKCARSGGVRGRPRTMAVVLLPFFVPEFQPLRSPHAPPAPAS